MEKNKIKVFEGVGRFIDATHIEVDGDKKMTLVAKNTIIATGSKPGTLPFITLDKERVITSTCNVTALQDLVHVLSILLLLAKFVDHQSIEDSTVTLRDRDSMQQDRIAIASLPDLLDKKLNMKHWLQKI